MQKIGRLSDYRDGTITKLTLGSAEIVIARDGSSIHAFAARCPHAGAPLEEGGIYNHRLICPWHKATFCLKDGTVVEPPALDGLARHAVEIHGQDVLVSPDPVGTACPPARLDGRKVLILGSGAGGTAAAVALRDAGFSGSITLIGSEEPYDRTVLSKFVLHDMPASEVPLLRPAEYWMNRRIERLEAAIVRLDAIGKNVHLADGTVLHYDDAVLATGATPNVPKLPGVTLAGVHSLRTRHDAASIVASATPGATAVVVGSSFIGLEAASALLGRGLNVTVTAPEPIPFQRQFGPEIGSMFRRLHEANGVRFRLQAKVAAFSGKETVDGVLLEGGERLAADLVVLGVGVTPATAFVDGVRKADDGGIEVDDTLRAADGLYVVGDCACFPFNGKQIRIEHWRVAQQHGRIAAANIAGISQHYETVPFFWTYHFGRRFECIGHPQGWDRLHVDGALTDQDFIGLQIQGDRVVGVIACQRERTTAILIERMRKPLTVPEAIDLLRMRTRDPASRRPARLPQAPA
jgi:NADPH-dependent 2,4-dienoyl-CoA reductase/sulfur reductase-like enzyme/nitrite reductase/ring-hydroxylating ferredoxin subunit